MTYYLQNGSEQGIAHKTARGVRFLGQHYDSIEEIKALGWQIVPSPC